MFADVPVSSEEWRLIAPLLDPLYQHWCVHAGYDPEEVLPQLDDAGCLQWSRLRAPVRHDIEARLMDEFWEEASPAQRRTLEGLARKLRWPVPVGLPLTGLACGDLASAL